MPRNEWYEVELKDAIKREAKQAVREEGVTATHVGLHPEDVRRLREYDESGHWEGIIYYWVDGLARPLEVYSDEGVPEGHAMLANQQAAFVEGWTDDPGVKESA
jgi:hypothetical protein